MSSIQPRGAKLVGGLVLAASLALGGVAIASTPAHAAGTTPPSPATGKPANPGKPVQIQNGFHVTLGASASGSSVVVTATNTGDKTLTNCVISEQDVKNRKGTKSAKFSLDSGLGHSETFGSATTSRSFYVNCSQASASVAYTYTPATGGPGGGDSSTGSNDGASAHTGDDAGFPVGIAGLVGMLIAGTGTAIGLGRKR